MPSGMIMPPPMPCRTRKNTSSVVEVEMPHSIDPPVNRIREVR